MSSFIYLVAMLAVAWLVLWAIRDPKEPKWDWWPIEWWPFDTDTEAKMEQEGAEARQAAASAGHRRAVPWRERSGGSRRTTDAGKPRWRR